MLVIVVTAFLHLWLRVPYVPTSRTVSRAMVKLANLRGDEVVYDLGAGNGRLLLEAKRMHPGITAIGCEFVPTIWLLGKIKILFSGLKIRWKLANALTEDVSKADVIFLYVTPHLMEKLREKFDRELRPGTRVISNTFGFTGKQPVSEEIVRWMGGDRKVRVYQW